MRLPTLSALAVLRTLALYPLAAAILARDVAVHAAAALAAFGAGVAVDTRAALRAWRLARAAGSAVEDPCAACGLRRAEFCDLCASCEETQRRIFGAGGPRPWTAEALAALRAREPAVCSTGPAVCEPGDPSAPALDAAERAIFERPVAPPTPVKRPPVLHLAVMWGGEHTHRVCSATSGAFTTDPYTFQRAGLAACPDCRRLLTPEIDS